MLVKTLPLIKEKIESSKDIMFDDATIYTLMPFFQGRDTSSSTYVHRHTTITDGDSQFTIGSHSIAVDGNLIFYVTWDDGLVIHRINNDGTLTQLYWDDSPGTMNYIYLSTIVLDTTAKRGWFDSSNNGYGVQEFDYSDIANGGSTVTYPHFEPQSELLYGGTAFNYSPGIVKAGNWIYHAHGSSSGVDVQRRFHIDTHINESLSVVNLDTEDMYRGAIYYDEVNDRVYQTGFYNGQVWCTVNASSDTEATTYQIRYEHLGIGAGNDNYPRIIVVSDDNPNHIWVGGNYGQVGLIDITVPLTGATRNAIRVTTSFTARYLYNYGHTSYPPFFKVNPDYGDDLLYIPPKYGFFRKGAWFDTYYGEWVGSLRQGNYYQSRDYLEFNYMAIPRQATSANGTKYWITAGYDYDGRYIYVHDDVTGRIILSTDAFVQFNDLTLDGQNIHSIVLNVGDLERTPPGTSVSYLASNNGGTTWESISKDSLHTFTSEGNSVKIKIMFSNPANKSAYFMSRGTLEVKERQISVTLIGESVSEVSSRVADVSNKIFVSRKRGFSGRRRR